MKSETIIEVVEELIGLVDPIGDTFADVRRYDNLEALCAITDHLIAKIKIVSMDADRPEHSMAKAGKRAKRFLEESIDFDDN